MTYFIIKTSGNGKTSIFSTRDSMAEAIGITEKLTAFARKYDTSDRYNYFSESEFAQSEPLLYRVYKNIR